MTDADGPGTWLLCRRLEALAARVEGAASEAEAAAAWNEADRAVAQADASEDADVALPVMERSLPDLRRLLEGWRAGTVPLPPWDKAVLKRAMNAFKRRLKLARLDDASSSGRNPLSRGGASDLLGIQPPESYPREVWDLLVAQGRLRDAGHGVLEVGEP